MNFTDLKSVNNDPPALPPLTVEEREERQRREAEIAKTFDSMGDAVANLVTIREKQLWRDDYSSFEAYTEALLKRWSKSIRRFNQLMAASTTTITLKKALPAGTIVPDKEGPTRPINGLPDDQKAQAWQSAVNAAGGQQPTAAQVAAARDRVLVLAAGLAPVTLRMEKGELKPAAALVLATAVQRCEPKVRGVCLQHQITDPALVLEVNRLFKTKAATYDELAASGVIQYLDDRPAVPLKTAKVVDLQRLLDQKIREYKQLPSPVDKVVVVNLFLGNPDKTFETLVRNLHTDDMDALAEMFANYADAKAKEKKQAEKLATAKA